MTAAGPARRGVADGRARVVDEPSGTATGSVLRPGRRGLGFG